MQWLKFATQLGLALALGLLAACSVPQIVSGRAFYSIQFDPSRESFDTQVISYRYGSSNAWGFHADADDITQGRASQVIKMSGNMLVGEFFHVKWRNTRTGKEYEDRVDLQSRLPFSMDKQSLHLIIEGAQLYIYVVSFDPVRDVMSQDEVDRIRAMHKTLRERVFSFSLRKRVIQIYPERQVDPHVPSAMRNVNECVFAADCGGSR